jgi:hypothetical protein
MPKYKDYLDELFIDKLGYKPDYQSLSKPSMEGIDNLVALSRDYVHKNVSVIVAECKDRIPVFQKQIIKEYKNKYPDAHFLFISNAGKVFDLYNYSTSKKLKAITYNEIERNTKLFKEKVQFFNASSADGSADLKVQIEKAFETTDKITRKFYDNFKGIHEKLTKAIKGIADEHDRKWYATTLLNRIMFIFFLQKNHVLQDDTEFLLTKFNEVKKKKKDYYHDFLLPLFFKGFAKKNTDAEKKEFVAEYGHVKYLNGGLFYPNKIELKYATLIEEKIEGIKITIPDATNPKITISATVLNEVITFLNGYTWYLDNRPTKDEKEINPDVLGYIFEKYINQKDLGAYYTKEDITEYISKNTIIPFIFDKLRNNGFEAPDPTSLITNNDDIIPIADEFITNCNDYNTLKFLYKDILQPLSVLDPSVGSGAFLFAALNILLPVYQSTIARLKSFNGKINDDWLTILLQNLSGHPEEYYLTKQIILNNLYGVDIVEEGVEICKLRLFLQLASHLADITAIEPLPDIDFNIYAGNSLVGGLSWADLQGNYAMSLFTKDSKKLDHDLLLKDIDALKNEKKQYKVMQADENADEKILKKQKDKIQFFENKINNAIDIGIENPFHWFVEYADIIERGGFDVIIGNPPYVEYNTSKNLQNFQNFNTIKCGNLYAYFIERSNKIVNTNSKIGVIVPMPSINTNRMDSLQVLLRQNLVWISSFDERPSSLFDGVDQRLSIILISKNFTDKIIYTTGINRWYSEQRPILFSSLIGSYTQSSLKVDSSNRVLKIKNEIENSIYSKFNKHQTVELLFSNTQTNNIISFRSAGGRYWKIFLNKEFPTQSLSNVVLYLKSDIKSEVLMAVFNSSLFWWYYSLNFDMYNLKQYMVSGFKFTYPDKVFESQIFALGKRLIDDIDKNAEESVTKHKTRGEVKTKLYKVVRSKPILDEIDDLLGSYYNFTKAEVSFIKNYDLQFRMGGDTE